MERRYVAIDLHRFRSLIVREDDGGHELGVVRIDNDPMTLARAVAEAGPEPEVAIEATYAWYWAVDVPPSGVEAGSIHHCGRVIGTSASSHV